MKKIWFIDESLDRMGGVERIISTLSNNLIEKYDVEAISLIKSNTKTYFDYKDKIKINYLYDKSNLLSKKLKKYKIIYYSLRIFEKTIQYLSIKIKAPIYGTKINPEDIVIYGRVETALEFLPFVRKTKKTIVREAIHIEWHKEKKKIKKYFPKKVDLFILSSEENKKSYESFFGENIGKLSMIKLYNPLGIVPKTIKNVNKKNIVSVGRYDTHKGFDYLIRAFANVNKKHSDWKLRIVGDGYYKNEMEKLIKQLNLEKCVILVPSTKNIVEELENDSIYVMASRFEGYANALVEAMACGLSCISYNWLMGVEEIIKNKENGIIVPLSDRYRYFHTLDIIDKDVNNLSSAIIDLIENEKLRETFRKNSIKIKESRNKDKIINKWLSLIEE